MVWGSLSGPRNDIEHFLGPYITLNPKVAITMKNGHLHPKKHLFCFFCSWKGARNNECLGHGVVTSSTNSSTGIARLEIRKFSDELYH